MIKKNNILKSNNFTVKKINVFGHAPKRNFEQGNEKRIKICIVSNKLKGNKFNYME